MAGRSNRPGRVSNQGSVNSGLRHLSNGKILVHSIGEQFRQTDLKQNRDNEAQAANSH